MSQPGSALAMARFAARPIHGGAPPVCGHSTVESPLPSTAIGHGSPYQRGARAIGFAAMGMEIMWFRHFAICSAVPGRVLPCS
jgi:hypothetical protein